MNKGRNYYVYILANESGTVLYTGVTNNLMRRLDEHKISSNSDSFASRYKVRKLVYFEEFKDVYSAITREKQIKCGSRLDKVELVHSINPNWDDLFGVW